MPEARFAVGEVFPLQFAWRLPDGGYLRAVFDAVVLDYVPAADKYMVRLAQLIAGREETEDGRAKSSDDLSTGYWQMAGNLVGRKITVAYEADDGRALHMRLETLTGEHNFFTRLEDAEVIARAGTIRQRAGGSAEDPSPEIGL